MASFNRVIMIGNLTKDPDYKQQQGTAQAVCRLSLASNRQFRNKQTGMMVQEVCYIDVDAWGAQAENCKQYLQKGRPVLVEGRLKLDTWKEADGQTRRRHSIVADRVVFLGSSQQSETTAEDETGMTPATSASAGRAQTSKSKGLLDTPVLGDDIAGEALYKDEPPFDDLPF